MKIFLTLLVGFSAIIWAENNESNESNLSEKAILEAQIKKQIEREKKYAQEQKFYQGQEYDLDAHKVDPKILEKVPAIEPEYDFDMTDVYSD
jgi:hypothetical protein